MSFSTRNVSSTSVLTNGDDSSNGGPSNARIYGSFGNDTINIGIATSMFGDQGDDILNGDGDSDEAFGGLGDDNIFGFAGLDLLSGDDGDDNLFGGDDADVLLGGAGDDSLVGGLGSDELYGNAGDDCLRGEEDTDVLYGEEGNDRLWAGAGIGDILIGGNGDDEYLVENATPSVREAFTGGIDHVTSSVSFSLLESATVNGDIENLTLVAGSAMTATGNDLANQIFANHNANTILGHGGNDQLFGLAGADFIDGGAGVDEMKGGDDDDTYVADNSADLVIELNLPFVANNDNDLVNYVGPGTFTLAANVERLTLVGQFSNASVSGVGNELANTIIGNAGTNSLSGLAGTTF